ncbi:hypothetical protein BDZ88DRAFT_450741 [Geranomyces variabilis]|nr:hypothetical protein BDZ88DRAFT_450741 [Geranomyces variabilis]KAJ3134846.1 hypothetical protein HDU90_004879 [Geranomyces variabilis]
MSDNGTYAALSGVPVVCKVYRPPPKVTLPPSFYDLVSNASTERRRGRYDFQVEKGVLEEAERFAQQLAKQAAARQEKLDKLSADRREWEKRQAPGLATDGRIMQPTAVTAVSTSPLPPAAASEGLAASSQPRMATPSSLASDHSVSPSPSRAGSSATSHPRLQEAAPVKKKGGLDYLEFEQGLPPPDPWRTEDDDDDLRMLKEVMSAPDPHPTSTATAERTRATSPTKHTLKEAVLGHAGDAVSRARALVATLAQHVPAVPSPPSKAADLHTSATVGATSSTSRKAASMQYPVLPGIANGGLQSVHQNRSTESPVDIHSSQGFSPTTKETFLKMTQMGFSREAVDRGIKQYGLNEKKILDFAIAFDEHRRSGFSGDDVELAVSLFNHDARKEREFLVAYTALVDFGFPKRRIQEALVLKNNDKEQALEYLVGSQGTGR